MKPNEYTGCGIWNENAMSHIESVKFFGASGKCYQFECYDLDTSFKSTCAVYILARRSDITFRETAYNVVYVGQTNNLRDSLFGHNKSDCFKKNNANCICINIQVVKRRRLEMEKDLRSRYIDAPPCNDSWDEIFHLFTLNLVRSSIRKVLSFTLQHARDNICRWIDFLDVE